MNFCPTHPPTPAVCSAFLKNCVIEFCPRSCSCGRVYSPRGHKSIFPILPFGCRSQRDSPQLPALLCSALLLAARPPLRLLVMKLLPIFHTLLPVGFFPWYTPNDGFDVKSLCFLVFKKTTTNKYGVVFSQRVTRTGTWNTLVPWCKRIARPCAKRLRLICKKMRVND